MIAQHPILAAMEAHALATQREFATDRTQTVGASEIGLCARRVFYLKNEPDAGAQGFSRDLDEQDRWGAKVRGSVYENEFWMPAMRRAWGERLLFAGAEQKTLVKDFLSATPDGLLVDLTPEEIAALGLPKGSASCVDLDCKTADPRTKLAEAKPEAVYQVVVQIGLLRELTLWQPTHGILSYTDASFWDEVKPFVVAFDPDVYAHAKARARDIMTARSAADLKPEGVIAGGKECESCAFTSACGQRRADLVPKSNERVEMPEDITAMALAARAARSHSDEYMMVAREAEHELRDAMAKHGARKMHGALADGREIRISWSPLAGRPSLDTKALKRDAVAAGLDISAYEKAGDPTDRLVITLTGNAEQEEERNPS